MIYFVQILSEKRLETDRFWGVFFCACGHFFFYINFICGFDFLWLPWNFACGSFFFLHGYFFYEFHLWAWFFSDSLYLFIIFFKNGEKIKMHFFSSKSDDFEEFFPISHPSWKSVDFERFSQFSPSTIEIYEKKLTRKEKKKTLKQDFQRMGKIWVYNSNLSKKKTPTKQKKKKQRFNCEI